MYKRLLTFLMLFVVSPVNLFADDTAGNASMSDVSVVINPGAGTHYANCSFDVLGTESGLVRFNARFVPNKYTVTYVAGNNGSGTGITDRDIEFDITNYTIRTASEAEITSNAGYHFDYWIGASNDPTDPSYYAPTKYEPGAGFNPYNIAGDLTLTAWHEPNETNIHYVCGAQAGGKVPGDDIATYGEKFIFAENTCDLFGHNFDYWSCVGKPGTTGLNAEYASGEEVNPWSYTGGHEETIICTAQWKLAEYVIRYRTDEGSGSMSNTPANYGQQNVTLRQNAFAKDKHFFNGWNCVDESGYNVPVNTLTNNGTKTYRINEMPASDVYCTAQWDQYNITYYGCIDSLETCTGDNRVELNQYFPEKTKYAPGYIVTYPTAMELNALSEFDGYTFNGGWYFNTGASAGTSTEIRTGNLTLYTVMKPLYSVGYRCDESEAGTEQGKYTKDSGVTAKTNDNCTPASGYSFDGWNCDNGVGNVAEGETFTMPAGDVMCTAIFTPNDYVLKYDCNIPTQPKEILYSDNLHVNENVNAIDYEQCENAGYEFSGWNCNNGVGNVVQGQEFTMPANDVTCIAEIEKMQFTLSYECEKADGGTVPSSQTGYYLDVLGLAENTCEKTGSTFTGWHCSDGTTYDSGDTITLQANTVCRSQWNTNKYSVTYECGEGTLGNPPVDTATYEFNASVITKLETDGTCQKTGQTFTNWKCGNVEVAAGSDFNITHDTTCVAQWSDNTYKLTYKHGLHGTGADYVENVVFGTEHTVLTADDAGMTANDGYEFDVWDCGMFVGNKYPNDTITMPANDVTCTAQWKLAEYVIRYRTDEGSGSMSNTPANYGQQNVTLRQNAFVNDYHFFNGWNCVADKDNSSVTVNTVTNNGTTVYKIAEMPASNVTCTAKWDYYSITYYGCVDSLDNCTGNNRIDLSSNFPAKTKYAPGYIVTYPTAMELNALSEFDGYTFNGGWYFDTGASAGTSTEIRTGNLILYTVMTQDKYTITYKPGNAGTHVVSGENKVRKVVYGGTQYIEPMGEELKTLSADTFSIVGYTFDKWLSNKNVATGASANVEYDADVDIAPYNVIGNTEMTAQWTPNHYKVTYIIAGDYALLGSSVVEDVYDENTQSGGATYDARYDIIVEANTAAEPIDGYVFAGWTTDSTPSFTNGALNNQWNGETIWTRDDDLTVYAAYKPKSYTISYNCGTGTTNSLESVTGEPPAPQNVEYMGEYSLAENENECVLPGAYFIGWRCDYDLDNGYHAFTPYLITEDGKIVEKTGVFEIDDDVTCSALWHDYEYNVTYDCGNDADEGSVAPTDEASYYYLYNAQAKDNLVNGNPACVRKNYDFDGWNCGGVDVNVGANFVVTQDTTCVARWAYICCDADSGQYLDTETGTCKTKPEHSHLVDNMCSEGYECDMGYKLTDDGYCEIDEVEINFVCGHGISRVRKGVYGTTETAPGEELCCDDGYCEVYGWNCDNDEQYDVGDGVAFLDGENLTCLADIEFNIRYKVYTTNDGVNWNEVNQVVVGGNTMNVSDLQPDKYRLDVHVAYPQISLQGYTFEGWYDYFDGEGFDDENKVTMTPDYNDQGELWIYGKMVKTAPCVINYHNVDGANNSNVSTYMVDGGAVNLNSATKQYYRFNGWHLGSPNGQVVDQIVPDDSVCGVDLYAEWEFECNEKGHEHWLHVGDGENDKICLYENRPYQNAAIVVVKGTSSDMNYYMMLSNDRNTLMHEGSNKKLRVMHNGTPYNACDMSTCAP